MHYFFIKLIIFSLSAPKFYHKQRKNTAKQRGDNSQLSCNRHDLNQPIINTNTHSNGARFFAGSLLVEFASRGAPSYFALKWVGGQRKNPYSHQSIAAAAGKTVRKFCVIKFTKESLDQLEAKKSRTYFAGVPCTECVIEGRYFQTQQKMLLSRLEKLLKLENCRFFGLKKIKS